MHKFLKSSLFILVITLFTMPFANAQEVRVIDNKGTIETIRNNNVYTSATDPNTSSTIALENDVWIDTSTTPSTISIFNNTNQWIPIKFGQSLFSFTTTVVNSDVFVNPPNTTQWFALDITLPQTNITVKTGDILDVRVNISEDFAESNGLNAGYNNIGDLLRFYVTTPALIGSPTMLETLITGGDNSAETAAGALNQLFLVTGNGTLTIGIAGKFISDEARTFSTEISGRGGLQVIIYR